jgi:integrase
MARKAKQLTEMGVKALKTEGFHRDFGDGAAKGLYVQVSDGAGGPVRSWIYRYTSPTETNAKGKSKARWMGLGPCDVIGLAEARDLARSARRLVKLGADPIEHRRATVAVERETRAREVASRMTFGQCADAYLAEHLESFRNPKHKAQWKTSLDRAITAFGPLHVAEIDTPILLKFLEPIWRVTPETGSRIRGRVEKVLDWAKARGFRDGDNPARWRGHLEHLLRARPKAEHHSAMPFAELPAFMGKLRGKASISARALEFLILTATRSGEVRGATWSEIDLDAGTWTIPADRMKAGREHTIPLSDRAVTLLEALPRCGDLVFEGAREGRPLSDMALTELLKGMDGNGHKVHGFRSTFRDWAGDCTGFDREVIEHALAHKLPDKVEAAYRRSSALSKRRKLMDDWSAYCESKPAKMGDVIPMRA